LDVDSTWDNAKQTKGKLDEYKPETIRGGHAIALVGYTPDAFIVRNSWGTTAWGDQGFGYASSTYAQTAFTESLWHNCIEPIRKYLGQIIPIFKLT
jgi:C1A family cysteine protease